MSMYIVHGVLLSPLYRLFSLILPWRAFKLSTYHCKTWIHITKMQLMKLYPSLYQELFQNTQTNSDIIESQRCRKIYSWKWYCQNFRTQPTDLSSCSAQERTFSEIPAPQTTITACFTNVRRFYWNSGRSLPCLVHSLTHCNALIRQSTHAFELTEVTLAHEDGYSWSCVHTRAMLVTWRKLEAEHQSSFGKCYLIMLLKLDQEYISLFNWTLFALAKALNSCVRFAFCLVFINSLFHNLMID